jgi:hypothetical protein
MKTGWSREMNSLRSYASANAPLAIRRFIASIVLAPFFLAAAASPAVSKETYLCTHRAGDMSFTTDAVLIERDKQVVTVLAFRSGKPVPNDRWAYQIHAENKSIGFQAIRANPESGGRGTAVAVDYGGLLFLNREKGAIYAFVVSAQSSTKKSNSQVLTCEER